MVGKVKGVVFILTPFILHTYSLYTFLKNWIWWPVMDFVLFSLYYILGLHVSNIVSAKPVFNRNWLLKIGDMLIQKGKKWSYMDEDSILDKNYPKQKCWVFLW